MTRVCPKRDIVCPHGDDCPFTIERYECQDETAPVGEGDEVTPCADCGSVVPNAHLLRCPQWLMHPAFQPPSPQPVQEPGLVDELRELRAFLDGSGELKGVAFGDHLQGVRGAFWWRKWLTRIDRAIERLQASTPPAPDVEAVAWRKPMEMALKFVMNSAAKDENPEDWDVTKAILCALTPPAAQELERVPEPPRLDQAAIREAQDTGWRLIDSAPAEPVLLAWKNGHVNAGRASGKWFTRPTHWHPLPSAPSAADDVAPAEPRLDPEVVERVEKMLPYLEKGFPWSALSTAYPKANEASAFYSSSQEPVMVDDVRLSKAQRAWLEQLRNQGPQPRGAGRGNTRLSCRKLGLSEWMMELDGEILPHSVVAARFPNRQERFAAGWRYVRGDLEIITEAGRAALKAVKTP